MSINNTVQQFPFEYWASKNKIGCTVVTDGLQEIIDDFKNEDS